MLIPIYYFINIFLKKLQFFFLPIHQISIFVFLIFTFNIYCTEGIYLNQRLGIFFSQNNIYLNHKELKKLKLNNSILSITGNRIFTTNDLRFHLSVIIPKVKTNSGNLPDFEEKINLLSVKILKSKTDNCLIVEEFLGKGNPMPKSFIENEYTNYIIKYFNDNRGDFYDYMKSKDVTIEQAVEEMKESLIIQLMLLKECRFQYEVSPKALKILLCNDKNYNFYNIESASFYQISICCEDINPNRFILSRAELSLSELNFDRLHVFKNITIVNKFQSLKAQKMEWVDESRFDQELSKTIFRLSPGKTSRPIFIKNQLYFFYILKKKELNEIKSSSCGIFNSEISILNKINNDCNERWLDELRRKSYISFNI